MDLMPRKFYLDDMFDDFLSAKSTGMKCDIYEKDGCYHVEMDTPGFSKDDLSISMDNGYLTITAEKSHEDNDDSKNYIRRERSYGKYERSFYLGEVDEENIYLVIELSNGGDLRYHLFRNYQFNENQSSK